MVQYSLTANNLEVSTEVYNSLRLTDTLQKINNYRSKIVLPTVRVTLVTHLPEPCMPLFCSCHILASSVIYYQTDARQHEIY